jgi:hypothetical protein
MKVKKIIILVCILVYIYSCNSFADGLCIWYSFKMNESYLYKNSFTINNEKVKISKMQTIYNKNYFPIDIIEKGDASGWSKVFNLGNENTKIVCTDNKDFYREILINRYLGQLVVIEKKNKDGEWIIAKRKTEKVADCIYYSKKHKTNYISENTFKQLLRLTTADDYMFMINGNQYTIGLYVLKYL